jgi:Protein of unknown function (DUF2769).
MHLKRRNTVLNARMTYKRAYRPMRVDKHMKVPDTDVNYDDCLCYQGCPTYEHNRLSGRLFCSRGKSGKPIEERECICPDCPVQTRFSLTDLLYCEKGAAD